MCVGWKKSLLVRVETHRFGLSQRKKQSDQLVLGSDVIIFWHFFLPLSFCSRSRLCLSSVVRDALASVMSRAALLPAEDSRALATPLSRSRSPSLSEETALWLFPKDPLWTKHGFSRPGGRERERAGMEREWGEGTAREEKRGDAPKQREELGLPRVQRPRNSFSRCPPPVRFLLVFWGEDF